MKNLRVTLTKENEAKLKEKEAADKIRRDIEERKLTDKMKESHLELEGIQHNLDTLKAIRKNNLIELLMKPFTKTKKLTKSFFRKAIHIGHNVFWILFLVVLIGCGEDNPVVGNKNISSLDTDFVPLIPVLKSPIDGDTAISLMPLFRWSNKGDSLQISDNAAFDNPLCFTVSDSSYNLVSQLAPNKWYYWKIGAKGRTNHITIIYWSEDIYHFRTIF